jgi:hypothetical protein
MAPKKTVGIPSYKESLYPEYALNRGLLKQATLVQFEEIVDNLLLHRWVPSRMLGNLQSVLRRFMNGKMDGEMDGERLEDLQELMMTLREMSRSN